MSKKEDQPTPNRPTEATERVSRVAGDELRTELDPDVIEKMFPQLVITNEEGEREVAYEGLVGLLIEAVKELDTRVSEVEGRLGGSRKSSG